MEANRWTLSEYLQIGFSGFPFGGLMSIDVTYRCNLQCVHCYFSRQDYTLNRPLLNGQLNPL